MTEHPILFSAPMVRAILAGTKTVTRRVVKGAPTTAGFVDFAVPENCGQDCPHTGHEGFALFFAGPTPYSEGLASVKCRHGVPGDRLWVRETFRPINADELGSGEGTIVAYRASCPGDTFDFVKPDGEILNLAVKRWKPGIHMPRWASRITLEIASVRVERLQAITNADALAEGIESSTDGARYDFGRLWDDINAERGYAWGTDPWVWRIEFRRVEVAHV